LIEKTLTLLKKKKKKKKKRNGKVLFNNQIISGDLSKIVIFWCDPVALFTEFIPKAKNTRQGFVDCCSQWYKGKLTRIVNAENVVKIGHQG